MPAKEGENEVNTESAVAPATQASIGIIYPPPEVRNIVDKTASFVARNGPEFEARIRQNEINNQKFNFLNNTDPYHSYYRHKVKEFGEGKGQEPSSAVKSGLGFLQQKPQQDIIKKLEDEIPKEAPQDFEFIADPPSISAYDLDIVRLTAQFVARNGRQFLTNLMTREQANYQFDFLRPQHSLFNYFTKLVEQYTKILIPSKAMLQGLNAEAGNSKKLYGMAQHRVEWFKHQEKLKKKEEDEKEKERVSYAQIDWHDFVVVETVDYQPGEVGNFPPMTTPHEVGARVLAQERFEKLAIDGESGKEKDDDATTDKEESEPDEEPDTEESDDEEAGSDMEQSDDDVALKDTGKDNDSSQKQPVIHQPGINPPQIHIGQPILGQVLSTNQMPPPPSMHPPSNHPNKFDDVPLPDQSPLPPNPDIVIIREYNPKASKVAESEPAADRFLISPITGERIPTEKIQEHMRIGLLDPRWIEQRDRAIQERREQEGVYAAGSAIGSSLKQLAELRSDIFGIGAEETQIGKKVGEADKKEKVKVVWDGHSGSMDKVVQKARENITVEEQIAVIHKVKGLTQDDEKEKIGPAIPKSEATKYEPVINIPKPPLLPPKGPTFVAQPPPPPGMGMPMRPVMMQPHPPPPPQVADDDEPDRKKSKTEEQLMNEEEFLHRFPHSVSFRVQLPHINAAEWPLHGQNFSMTLPPSDTIAVIKAKIFDEIGMPTGKQKLQLEGMFLKDTNTLAYYNMSRSSIVYLQVKERGGRKK